jgi:hypothetical protein
MKKSPIDVLVVAVGSGIGGQRGHHSRCVCRAVSEAKESVTVLGVPGSRPHARWRKIPITLTVPRDRGSERYGLP